MFKWIAPFVALLGLSVSAAEQQTVALDATEFGKFPAMHGGRLMPLDSVARNFMLQIAGKSAWKQEIPHPKKLGETKTIKRPAIDWLAKVMFAPAETRNEKLFLVENPEVSEALGQDTDGGRMRYSFAELEESIPKIREIVEGAREVESTDYTPVQREVLRLNGGLQTYLSFTISFLFTMPRQEFAIVTDENRQALTLPEGRQAFTFYELIQRGPALSELLETARNIPQDDWQPQHMEIMNVATAMFRWAQQFADVPIDIIPIAGHGEETWMSPWDAINSQFSRAEVEPDLTALNYMAAAYRAGDQAAFDQNAAAFSGGVVQRLDKKRVKSLKRELKYNKADPFYRAELLYGLGMLVAMFGITSQRKLTLRIAVILCLIGFIPHTWGLVQRCLITGRPPITNLFATFVFVGWACVLMGFLVEWFNKRGLGSLSAGLSGMVLLLVSGRWAAEGDTMSVLVPVLNSNFWLATHVVAINLGYAGVGYAGIIAMIYLCKALRRKKTDPDLMDTGKMVYGVLGFGLTFAFLGTMLGGVWADQSWGRFWGWDPKENGALLTVIWSGIMFHARMGRMVSDLGFAAGTMLGLIILLYAWLGTNLHGVGLHAYGFTSGVKIAMLSVMGFVLLFVAVVTPLVKYKVFRKVEPSTV